jgi:endonuclease-3
MQAILNSLLEQHGSLSLEHLRQLPADDIKAQLSSYKGVGPKTIACVLMFCLGRAEFPVDTHVWEISKQLGWVAAAASREQTYEHLNACVPDDIK